MKHTKIFATLLSLVCSIGFYACDDDNMLTPLDSPTPAADGVTYESLAFSWDAIPNAVQYGYRLSTETAEAIAGVTHSTSVTFDGLAPATTYTLEVWAFAAMDGDYTTPPAVVLTATTDALIKLDKPELTVKVTDGTLKASWTKVESAEKYSYTITKGTEEVKSGSSTKTSLSVKGLAAGEYVFTIRAVNTSGGYEESDPVEAPFKIEAKEIWRAQGTYHSIELNSSWPATIVAFSNSTYSILAFYGVEGYNLDFAVNTASSSDMFSFTNGQKYVDTNGWKYWNVPTGLTSPDVIWAYPWDNYCSFSGDATSGEVNVGLYYGDDFDWGYDTFTWGSTGADFDINTLPGTYDTWCYGTNADDNWNYDSFEWKDYSSTIEKTGTNTISLDNFYWTGCPITGTVDASAMTITFAPQQYYWFGSDGYLFGSSKDVGGSVVAQINDDGSITLPDFGIWYQFDDGSTYIYGYGTAEMVKVTETAAARRIRKAPQR